MVRRNRTRVARRVCQWLLLIVASSAGAQGSLHTETFNMSPQDFVDTIPIRYELGQVLLPARTGGGTVRMLLDTGYSMGGVWEDGVVAAIDTLGAETVVDANGVEQRMTFVRLEPIVLGKVRLEGYVAGVAPRSLLSECMDDCVLGFNFVQQGVAIKIDVRRGQLVISDRRDFFKKERGYALKYRRRSVPQVCVSPSKGFRQWVTFDTGNNGFYSINQKEAFAALTGRGRNRKKRRHEHFEQQIVWSEEGQRTMGIFGMEAAGETAHLLLDEVYWGKCCLQKVEAATHGGSSSIGSALLEWGTVVIDPFRRRIIFNPYEEGDMCRVNGKCEDYSIVPKEGRLYIGAVNKKSDVYRQGMRRGDCVKAVDGVEYDDVCAFIHRKRSERPVVRLTLVGEKGREKEIVVTE